MRAARIHDWGGVPVIEEIDEPVRASGETLVRIEAATVSHLDLTIASGLFTVNPPLPYVPGVEGSGTVVESAVFEPGTQIIFREGWLGFTQDGTWRECASVPDGLLVPLTTTLDPAIASTFFVPLTTAYVALFDIGRLRAGQSVIVTGASGAIGTLAVQLAQAAGAEVVAVVSRASRLDLLPPGVRGIALDDENAVLELAAARPADLLVDTVGGKGLGDRLKWVRSGGRAACLGYTAGTALTIDLPSWLFSNVAVLPVNLLNREDRAHAIAEELLPRIAAGELSIPVEEFALDEIAEGITRLASGAIKGRAVVRF